MEHIKLEHRDEVALLTIDRQSALNALNSQVLNEMSEALSAIDPERTRCLVITGAGKAFVAGADVAEMTPMNAAEAEAFGRLGLGVMRKIETLAIPVIAAVNGFAIGGGCELALACDIRLVSETAFFSQPEVGLGITAGFGGTQRLPRLVGEGPAKQMLFTGERVGAGRAMEIGLANRVCAPDALVDEALEMARAIAAKVPLAVRATKRAIEEGRSLDMDGATAVELRHFAACFDTEERREAMAAMIGKRK